MEVVASPISSSAASPKLIPDSNAYDLILVRRENDNDEQPEAAVACSEAMHCFGSVVAATTSNSGAKLSVQLLVVSPSTGETLRFPIRNNFIRSPEEDDNKDAICSIASHCTNSLRKIAACLQPGKNRARFLLVQNGSGGYDGNDEHIVGIAPLNIFLWSTSDKLIVIDVDGTVTRTTKRGFLNTAVYEDFSHSHCHSGVCQFLQSVPNVRFVYLTNRPITYADPTRRFLAELRQEQHRLPEGPSLGYSGDMAGLLRMDFVDQNPHTFKFDTLTKYVCKPYRQLGVTSPIFEAGFGNTLYDMRAYHNAGIQLHRMFLIDKQSQIYCLDKNEVEPNNDADRVNRALDHPKQYAMERGTLFSRGYEDERLLSFVLGCKTCSTYQNSY